MTKEEFIKLAVLMGYSEELSAKKYVEDADREEFTDDDFIDLYHKSMHWSGCKSIKGLRSVYGMNTGCRTTAIHGSKYSSGASQDWTY